MASPGSDFPQKFSGDFFENQNHNPEIKYIWYRFFVFDLISGCDFDVDVFQSSILEIPCHSFL